MHFPNQSEVVVQHSMHAPPIKKLSDLVSGWQLRHIYRSVCVELSTNLQVNPRKEKPHPQCFKSQEESLESYLQALC